MQVSPYFATDLLISRCPELVLLVCFAKGIANAMENAMELQMPPPKVYACIVCFNKTIN